MNTITSWIMSIFTVIIIGIIVDLLFSNSRMGKFVKSAAGCITLLLIILPIPNIVKNGFSADINFLASTDTVIDQSYMDYVNDYKTKNLINGVNVALKEDGITGAVITVSADFKDNQIDIVQVIINLDKVVIPEKFQHINKNELIIDLVSGYLNIDKVKVSVL